MGWSTGERGWNFIHICIIIEWVEMPLQRGNDSCSQLYPALYIYITCACSITKQTSWYSLLLESLCSSFHKFEREGCNILSDRLIWLSSTAHLYLCIHLKPVLKWSWVACDEWYAAVKGGFVGCYHYFIWDPLYIWPILEDSYSSSKLWRESCMYDAEGIDP